MKNISEYAVPKHFIGIIFGTMGHRAAGVNEKPMLNNTIKRIANALACIGNEKPKCTNVNMPVPMIIKVTPRPYLS